jgi:hypothetical protein
MMAHNGRTIRYALVACWALFLGLFLVNSLAGVFGERQGGDESSLEKDLEDSEPESAPDGLALSCCLGPIIGLVTVFIIPTLLIIYIVYIVRSKTNSMYNNKGKRPRVISPIYNDRDLGHECRLCGYDARDRKVTSDGMTVWNIERNQSPTHATKRTDRMILYDQYYETQKTVKHIHCDVNKLYEMMSKNGTGIPVKCPTCRGPVKMKKGGPSFCGYCGTTIDYEIIKNGIMKLLS